MNNETAILIGLTIAVFVIGLVFGFSQNVLGSVEDSLLGDEDSKGIIDCNPAENSSSDGCPQESSFEKTIDEPANTASAL